MKKWLSVAEDTVENVKKKVDNAKAVEMRNIYLWRDTAKAAE